MALYVGETVRITMSAVDYDATTPLTDSDVVSSSIVLYDTDDTELLNSSMTYSSANGYWYYDWDTTGRTSGSYRFKTQLSGSAWETWEYGKVRLKANPV